MKNKKSSVILVFNDKKELALQLRAAHDKSYPLHWDFSAAGGIEENEDHKNAAIRELKEELGIEGEIEFIGEVLYQSGGETDNLYIYKTTYNGQFSPNPNEVERIQFFSMDKIKEMIESGEKFHPEFLYVWNKGIIEA